MEHGSGNIFRYLGSPNPERERLKARLMLQICRLRPRNFSVERVMDFLTSLGQYVEIIKPTSREHGEVSLVLG